MKAEKHTVKVGKRELTISNLGKVLYPETGFTKGDVIDYYARVGQTMLSYVGNRPMTLKRYPDGVEGKFFFEKQAPRSAPDWIKTAHVPSTNGRSDFVDHAVLSELAAVVWVANLAALELHVPMWHLPRGGRAQLPRPPDLIVFDLDPGAPADIVQCCQVALQLAKHLEMDGFEAFPKTSGSKGLQLYARIDKRWTWDQSSSYAHELAKSLERELPELVVSKMAKALRTDKVFIDWSQNSASKTTIAPYSLRARPQPTVSTPVTWAEVERCASSHGRLSFQAAEVLERLETHGDLFAGLLTHT